MNLSEMLYEMCHNVLSAADIKAICKSRGFSDREADSRSLFENVFLSSTGLETVMKTLTTAESAALHLLYMGDRAVDVSFFERLYGVKPAGYRDYGTFTQRYRPIYDFVQRNLIRKGLLIITEARTSSSNKAKMELWRYCFPPDFGSYLPSLFEDSLHTDQSGVVQADKFRAELHRLGQEGSRSSPVQLVAGNLTIDNRPFKAKAAQEWRQERWEASVLASGLKKTGIVVQYERPTMYKGYLLPEHEYHKETPLPAIVYALSKLTPDEWISPNELNPLLDVLYARADHPTTTTIFMMGWEHGCLAQYRVSGMDYYRLVEDRDRPVEESPQTYLPSDNGSVFVDLDKVPYEALEYLNRITSFKVEKGRLKAVPNLNKMVDAFDALGNYPLTRYLQEQDKEFRNLLKKVNAQWGKLIVHENLLVARITDLSLRVKLQKAFQNGEEPASTKLILLPGEYVAFPRAMLGEVEKVIKKAGHVIKTIQAK